jgi:PAS domain S-box-containing protein
MAHPLLCWDIVMEGNARRKEFAEDITALQNLMTANCWRSIPQRSVDNCIVWENKVIVVTNPALQIVWATKNMYEMNGYKPNEVIGKHPKMFQGEATTIESRAKIKSAINSQSSFECNILNYRKDGTIYNCHIEGYPIFNKQGTLINYIAFENVA